MSRSCASQITQVIVHARGALITRRVTLTGELPDGDVDLVVPGITALCEPGSARASVSGADRAVVFVQTSLAIPETPAQVGKTTEQVRALDSRIDRLRSEHGLLTAQQHRLSATRPELSLRATSLHERPDSRSEDALLCSALLDEQIAGLDERLLALDEQVRELERQRQAAALALAQESSGEQHQGQPTRSITVRLSGNGPAGEIDLSYVVPAARWWPVYMLRLTEGGRRASWCMEALVAQCTEEDWRGVGIALSTADLLYDARLPELPSLRLSKAQPAPRRAYRPLPPGLSLMFAGYDRAFPAGTSGQAGPPPPQTQRLSAPAKASSGGRVSVQVNALSMSVTAEGGTGGGGEDDEWEQQPTGDLGAPLEVLADTADPDWTGAFDGAVRGSAGPGLSGKMKKAGPLRERRAAAPGGAPPMAPMAPMAAPQGMPALAAPSIGGRPGSAAPALSRSMAFGGGGPPMAWAAAEPEPPEPELAPPDTWLDFAALRLGPADDRAGRGKLTLAPDGEQARRRQQAGGAIEALSPAPHLIDPRSSRGLFDHRYAAAGTADLPSDGQAHRLMIHTAETAARLRFRCAPREAAEVYREVELQNPFDAPLLAGPVDVYAEGSLLLTASISGIDRGGTMQVGMGVEERLRVARNVRVEEQSAGMLGGSTAVTHTVSLELASALGTEVAVEVLDTLPVSDDKAVEIDRLPGKPEPVAYKQAERGAAVRGGLSWTVPVPAGGKATVEHRYRITIPAKNEIVGGNRRE